MQSLVIFSCLIAATLAVTPFFESPDNHQASAFYKKPAGHYVPVAPVAPVYKPAPVPVYKPAPVPSYNPSYKAPEYKSEYSHGATSYQRINLEVGEPSYKPEYKPHY